MLTAEEAFRGCADYLNRLGRPPRYQDIDYYFTKYIPPARFLDYAAKCKVYRALLVDWYMGAGHGKLTAEKAAWSICQG